MDNSEPLDTLLQSMKCQYILSILSEHEMKLKEMATVNNGIEYLQGMVCILYYTQFPIHSMNFNLRKEEFSLFPYTIWPK